MSVEGALAEMPPRFPGLRLIVDRATQRMLEQTAPGDALIEIRRELFATMGPEPPTLQSIAKRLHVAPRTLQRHLAQADCSFSTLLEETRQQLAERHLEEDRVSISEIAYLLGYSEPSAFTRAFRRWCGISPLAFRNRRRRRSAQ